MSKWTLEEVIEAQRRMVRYDLRTAHVEFEAGRYADSAASMAAAIGEMGGLVAFDMVQDGSVGDE